MLVALLLAIAARADWPTYGHDPQRSGSAPEETRISVENAPALGLRWKAKLTDEPYSLSALTAPVVATKVTIGDVTHTVVYVGGIKRECIRARCREWKASLDAYIPVIHPAGQGALPRDVSLPEWYNGNARYRP